MSAPELLVVLGHENASDGSLSQDAVARVHRALQYIQSIGSQDTVAVVTTGGFGRHFNESNAPHGKLLMEAMAKSAVMDNIEFLNHVHSCGTLEDALGVLRLLRSDHRGIQKVTVVTSAYHRPRAEFIFSRIIPFVSLKFVEDDQHGTKKQLHHEETSLFKLRRVMPRLGGMSSDAPESAQMLADELRHYDNLSYFAIAASFLTVFLWATSTTFSSLILVKIISSCLAFSISFLFYLAYIRLAGTAASARRTLSALSFLSGRAHLGASKNEASRYTPNIKVAVTLALFAAWLLAAMPVFVADGSFFGVQAETEDQSRRGASGVLNPS